MKKIFNITLILAAIFAISGCEKKEEKKAVEAKPEKVVEMKKEVALDGKTMCDIKANGIDNVIATAKKYNEEAKKQGLEFRRLGVNNSALIISVEEAIKTGAKEVNPKDFKGKASKTKLETNYAAQRACKFAIAALTQAEEGKNTWRQAVPGDGYKY